MLSHDCSGEWRLFVRLAFRVVVSNLAPPVLLLQQLFHSGVYKYLAIYRSNARIVTSWLIFSEIKVHVDDD